jgi:hypothetical protein
VCLNGVMETTKITDRTMLGVPVQTQDFARNRSAIRSTGERVHATKWLADGQYRKGELVVNHVKGDARKGTLVVFHAEVIPGGLFEDAAELAAGWLV